MIKLPNLLHKLGLNINVLFYLGWGRKLLGSIEDRLENLWFRYGRHCILLEMILRDIHCRWSQLITSQGRPRKWSEFPSVLSTGRTMVPDCQVSIGDINLQGSRIINVGNASVLKRQEAQCKSFGRRQLYTWLGFPLLENSSNLN